MRSDIKTQLKQTSHFALLRDEQLSTLATAARIMEVEAGNMIFARDDIADTVYIVLAGDIALEIIGSNGRSVRVATAIAGEIIGEFGVLDRGVRTTDAKAQNNATLLVLNGDAYRKCIFTNAEFSAVVIKDLIGKLRSTNAHIEDLSLRSLPSRLANLLVVLKPDDAACPVTLKITQVELADRLSATREKINNHLQTIKNTGAIVIPP